MIFFPQAAPSIFSAMAAPLLRWYASSAREMPWRMNSPDPYRTLVSEIMLQQTRVETVKPYYERFIAELPTVAALAAADEERLLKLWEGLGYYSRVRNLRKAAQTVMREFGGKLPADRDLLLSLPGIGEYTAGAIASIAFGLPEPAVDGNVLRVCARLADCHADIAEPALRRETRSLLKAVYPQGKCSDFTQSIMDLGAVVCLPGTPHCPECPLAELCLARKAGTAPALPVKKAAPGRKIENRTVFLLFSGSGRIALRKRPASGILAGLWEYPAEPGKLTRAEVGQWLKNHQIEAANIRKAGFCKHIFTHLEWHQTGWLIQCRGENSEFTWTALQDLHERYSLPSAFQGFADAVNGAAAGKPADSK